MWRIPRSGIGTGPTGFMHRLMSNTPQHLARFTPLVNRSDLFLCLPRQSGQARRKMRLRGVPLVLRLDGIYPDQTGLLQKINQEIRETYLGANGVIFQSEFTRYVVTSVFGPPPSLATVIYNGSSGNRSSVPKPIEGRPRLLILSRWDARKRNEEAVRCFVNYPRNSNYDLLVAGIVPPSKRVRHPRIKYLGRLHPSQVMRTLNSCSGLLHLAWYDWCPNSVIEALTSGVPVICTNLGGTKEIVKRSGIIIDNDDVFDWTDHSLMSSVPPVRQELFNDALDRLLEGTQDFEFPRTDLFIQQTAKQYVRFFSRILSDAHC